MIKSFILCIISIFAIYGIINFIFTQKNKTIYIIGTHNCEDTIESKLRLALIRNNTIIVVDSGSTDDTIDIVKKMAMNYPCIKLIEKTQC